MATLRIDSPWRLTTAYVVFATTWIVGSDWWVSRWDGDQKAWMIDSAKGLLFVAVTAGLLHVIIRRLVVRHRKIEHELRESQLRWQFALEGSGDGLWDWNALTDEVYFSRQWKAMLGYRDNEIGTTLAEWESRVHPDDLAAAREDIRRYLAGESATYHSEHRLKAKDGSYLWILDRGQIVSRSPDGRPLRMIGTHTNITSRKANEARLHDALAFANAVLHSSPMGIVVYGPDGQAEIVNLAAAQIIGSDVPGLLRQNFRELESWKRSGLLALAEQAFTTQQETKYTGAITTSFGRTIWVEARLVPFAFQGTHHLLFLLADETGKHRALEDLHLMQVAVQSAPVGWVVTDADGKIEWVNAGFTTLTGYSAEEAIGRNPRVLKSGRHSPEFYAGLWQTIKRGEVWSGEMINQRKDGAQYNEHMTIAPVRGPDGAIIHFVAIKQDTTDRKQLEQQVARTQRLESIGMLASGIAHDLNNIFAPILLSLELLKLKYPTADGRRMLEIIESAGQRGSGIVRQVLTFARGIDGERTAVQPKYLIKELNQMLGETLPRSIAIELMLETEVQSIEGDATQLHQVLLNLAINARDAMPDGGRLIFGARNVLVDESRAARNPPLRPGPCVALTVRDTGTGITPQVLEHIFEPFFTTKPRSKGTGLGLSTVFGIVRSHGGAVEVTSEVGTGTEFTVLFPAISTVVARGNSRPSFPVQIDGAGRQVLLVDDEDSIRVITRQALERFGFVVETAADGLEALDVFQRDPARFAVVVTDLMMPRLGGLDLVREIRLLAPALPVIVSSGMTEEGEGKSDTIGLATLGVHILLRKPYGEPELLKALDAALGPSIDPTRMEKKD